MVKPKKVVVVIEKPEKCEECPLVCFNPYPQVGFKCRLTGERSIRMEKLNGCPLQDFTEKNLTDTTKQTNADRIRSMTNEELAQLLERFELGDIDYAVTFCDLCKEGGNALNLNCSGCLSHWLESECDTE